MLRQVYFPCQAAEYKWEGVFRLEGNAIVPGKFQPSIGELDVLFGAEPIEACPKEIDMDAEDDLAEEDGIIVIQLLTSSQCRSKSGEGDLFSGYEQSLSSLPQL